MERTEENIQLRNGLLSATHRFHRFQSRVFVKEATRQECFTLEMIARHSQTNEGSSGIYVSDLAKCQRMSKPAISRSLRSMEEKGWITKVVDKKDQRYVFVELTETGKKKRQEMLSLADDFIFSVIQKMGSEKVEQLTNLWNQMNEIIDEEIRIRKEKGVKECQK